MLAFAPTKSALVNFKPRNINNLERLSLKLRYIHDGIKKAGLLFINASFVVKVDVNFPGRPASASITENTNMI